MAKEFNGKVPLFVSFVTDPCEEATNAVKIHYKPLQIGHKMAKFGVCVKPLLFPFLDFSKRLIEWIELNRATGAEKIFVYYLSIHANMKAVLDYYANSGFVEFIRTTLPGNEPNHIKEYQYLLLKHDVNRNNWNDQVGLTDCLYQNMYRVRLKKSFE